MVWLAALLCLALSAPLRAATLELPPEARLPRAEPTAATIWPGNVSPAEGRLLDQLADMTAAPTLPLSPGFQALDVVNAAPRALFNEDGSVISPEDQGASLFDQNTRKAAAEIELDLSPKVMAVLTTTDGTVLPVVGSIAPPRWLARRGKGWKATPWETLSYPEKIRLLKYVGPKRERWSRVGDRSVAGLVMREKVTVDFKRPVELLGVAYTPGKHEVDIKGATGRVEYRDEKEIPRGTGVELHLLSDQGAGAAASNAWTLLDGLGIKRVPLHVHALGTPPSHADQTEKMVALEAATRGEIYRCANLLAEFITIVHDRGNIYELSQGFVHHFGSLTRANFDSALSNLRRYLNGGGFPDSAHKIAWVGLRGPRTYDDAGDILGLEYRAMHPRLSAPEARIILDAVHTLSHGEPPAELRETMRRWRTAYGRKIGDEDPQAATWYNGPYYHVEHLRPDLRDLWDDKLAVLIEKHDQIEVKMLLHDWSRDPLLMGRRALRKKIEKAQRPALLRLKAGADVNVVVRSFLRETGLYAVVLDAFGLKEGRFGKIEKK